LFIILYAACMLKTWSGASR